MHQLFLQLLLGASVVHFAQLGLQELICVLGGAVQPLTVRQNLAARHDLHLLQLLLRPLLGGIEGTDGIHLVIEELHPEGIGGCHGEEIQNAAPDTHFPFILYLIIALITHGGKPLQELLQLHLIANP
ncbi:hypothetical protein D3C75_738420 [compost metagenome]